MTNQQWADLKVNGIAEYMAGDAIEVTEGRAVFRLSAPAEHAAAGSCVVLCETHDQSACEEKRQRYLDAMFLQHPNLVRVFDSGCLCVDGQWVHFAVIEGVQQPMTAVQDPVERTAWIEPACAALEYLHSNNLIYCALSATSIWRSAAVWKLGDFGELRAAGNYDPKETRRLMLRRDISVPPEAWEGRVTPKWDSWSLGTLLRIMGSRDVRVADLLEPSASERMSVADFARGAAGVAAVPEPSGVTAAKDPEEANRVPPFSWPVTTPRSPHAEEVHSNALRLMTFPSNVIVWICVLAGLAVLILLVAGRWGSRAPAASPHAVQQQPAATEPPGPVTTPHPSAEPDPKSQIRALLARWAQSTRSKDVDALLDCYAPVVQRSFGARNLRTSDLRKSKVDTFRVIGRVRSFDISDVSIDRLGKETAIASFRKRWDFPDRHFSGAERDQMELRRVAGEWKIVSEREIGQRKTEVAE